MPQQRIDLAEEKNEQCQIGCDKQQREAYEEDASCGRVKSVFDGLPVRCVGPWAKEKIYFLQRYFDLFSIGMRELWKPSGLGYFEIGCGPGRCIDRRAGVEFDGTALAIMKSASFANLKAARFIDIEPQVVGSLNSRISAIGQGYNAQAITGSYTDGHFIASTIKSLNSNGLNLVFFDPTDCSVPFSTLREIHNSGVRFDLIINVATKSDFSRNIGQAIDFPGYDVRKKYECFLGDPAFFSSSEVISHKNNNDFESIRRLFAESYQAMLSTLGFHHFGRVEIDKYYELVFASGHSRGLDFWQKAISGITITGQRSWAF
jgi:three-Cys-motif partner protein